MSDINKQKIYMDIVVEYDCKNETSTQFQNDLFSAIHEAVNDIIKQNVDKNFNAKYVSIKKI